MDTGAGQPESTGASSFKFVANVEARLFQRPDDAIHRGYDKVTEADFVRSDNFFSNYEPLPANLAQEFVEDAIGFHQFTELHANLHPRGGRQWRWGLFRLLRQSAPGGR